MNERIKELAEQAAHDTRLAHNNAYWRMQNEIAEDATWREKFAELIVRECAELTLDYKNEAHYNGWLDHCDAIKKHFGIEE